MSRNAVETVMGAVVLVVAALFLFFAYTTSQVARVSGYELLAKFSNASGLKDGGDVRISGIKVGSVTEETLDPKTFQAIVHMSIDPSIKLSVDSVAEIASSGLLGDNFINIEPGNEDDLIAPGGTITHTQAAMSLENLIGQVIYNQAQGSKSSSGNGASGNNGGAPEHP
ncbi:MAG TPA: outer membrane lipid asymmetry maintenance protein MlaD [Stellaceae bacterium]|nr:outer membrane lipid asymmetry maintenance protein MlaD [Stellaceae bacterium]